MTNKKVIILFGAIIVFGFAGIIIAKVSGPKPQQPSSAAATNNARQSSQSSIQGIDSVLNFGVSSDQESDLRYSINKYVTQLSPKPKSLAVKGITATPYDSTDPNARTAITFDLLADNVKLKATFQYFTLTGGNLMLTDNSGTTVYSSGDVDLSNSPPQS